MRRYIRAVSINIPLASLSSNSSPNDGPSESAVDHQILQAIEQTVLNRTLSSTEQQILLQSFQGNSYETMAQETSYVPGYLKVVGSRLWQEFSTAIGKKVTKKNAQVAITQHLQSQQAVAASPPLSPSAAVFTQGAVLEGPIPLSSPFYIPRLATESRAYSEITQSGCLLRLKAPRKYGKSSLLLRLVDHASGLGFRPVLIDFKDADLDIFKSISRSLRWLCANVAQQLQLSVDLDALWDPDLGSKLSCKAFLQEQVLTPSPTPVLLVLNEVDYVFEHQTVAQDFLPLIRSCYEQARASPLWGKLRWVMVYATDIYVPLQLNQSPFNVGVSLSLPPFCPEQVRELAQRYGLEDFTPEQGDRLRALLGGKPYLLNLAFYALTVRKVPFEQLIATAPTPIGIYGPHLHRCLTLLLDQPDLIAALEQVTSGAIAPLDPMAAYKLAGAGLVTLEGHNARMSCDLYRSYFQQVLHSEPVTP